MANYDVIAILASLDSIWWLNVALSIYYPNLASSGHIRGCRDADIQAKRLSSGIYPSKYAIVDEYDGPLKAAYCYTSGVRYDMVAN